MTKADRKSKMVRLNIDMINRFEKKKYTWETWSSFFNRMLPEDDSR